MWASLGETGLHGKTDIESESAGTPANSGLRFGQIIRRRLTIVFVDLVNSTQFATSHDLEDIRDRLLAFLEAVTTRIKQSQGYVARYTGDGLLAYFGYPISQENAAASAVTAALAAQEAIARIAMPDGSPIRARIGIATGEVTIGDIVGEGLASECMLIGVPANLGARLQTAAQPGEVLICDATYQHCASAFAATPTEPLQLKGFESDVIAWRVSAPREAARFQHRLGLGLNPLAGRRYELDRLTQAFASLNGCARHCHIVGPPGIGKSRLLHALRTQIELPRQRWASTAGTLSGQALPFYGLARLLRELSGKAGSDPSLERRARRLTARLGRLGIEQATIARLIGIAGFPTLKRTVSPPTDGETRRLQLRDDCIAALRRAAMNGAVAIAIEDAHWLDPSTAELVAAVVPLVADLPVMLITTSRELPSSDWDFAETIELTPLDRAEVAELVKTAAGRTIAPDALNLIVDRASGVPLFAEELARLLAANEGQKQTALPGSLTDLLLFRIDRGANGLAVAQAVALLGEDAHPEAVAEISGLDFATVVRVLDRLAIEDVLQPPQEPGNPIAFRHALFAEAAYDAMPRRLRRSAHLVAANLLERQGAPAARIAQHHEETAEPARAIQWWRAAGQSARTNRAMPEAANAFSRAIALLGEPSASDSAGHAEQLELHSARFEVLQILHGYSAAETTAASAELRELVERQGDLEQQMFGVAGQWAAASSAGEYDLANRHAARAPAIARALGTADAKAAAAMIQLTARYRVGDLQGSEDAWQAGLGWFDDPVFVARPGGLAQTFGNAALVAWLRGDTAAVAERLARLREAGELLKDPYNQTFIQHMIAIVEVLREDNQAACAAACAALELAEQHGFAHYVPTSMIALGAANARLGNIDGGLASMREGLVKMQSSPSRSGITMYHAWLAQAELDSGDPELAVGTIFRALRQWNEERFFRPELLRLEAIAEARLGRTERFAQLIQQASDTAQTLGAEGLLRRISLTLENQPATPENCPA